MKKTIFTILAAAFIFSANSLSNEIRIKEYSVFDGNIGWQHNKTTYRLGCAAVITELNNNDLLTVWISGSDNEPATDNCALISRSSDGGQSWSSPEILAPAENNLMTVCSNIYQLKDSRVIALWAKLPVEEKYAVWHYYRMFSSDNGENWTKPEKIEVFPNDGASLFEGKPLTLNNGDIFFAGTCIYKRPQPLLAPKNMLIKAESEAEALAMKEGKGNNGNIFAKNLHGCVAFIAEKQDTTGIKPTATIKNRPMGLLEPTCLQLNDGSIVMLMRAQYDGFVWKSESFDNGRSWTSAYRTDIPNPSSMLHLTRLPDGRIVLIHNATGGAKRDPLSIWISNDEMKTWYIKEDIITGGKLAYPNGIVLKNGKFVFVYDKNRREIKFVEVDFENTCEKD